MLAKNEDTQSVTRRKFLRNAGLAAGGIATSSVFFLSACGEAKEITTTATKFVCPLCDLELASLELLKAHFESSHADEGEIASITKTKQYIKVHPERCVGCEVCILACSSYHEGATSRSMARIRLDYDPLAPDFYEPKLCQQCDYPACYFACPLRDQALCIDQETGAKYVVADKCNGCGECVAACPISPPRIVCDESIPIMNRKAFKCDLCIGREGGPACVEFCQTAALTLVGENIEEDDIYIYGKDAPKIGDLV